MSLGLNALQHNVTDSVIHESHQIWWQALLLIGSNIFAIPAIWVAYRLKLYLLGTSIITSFIISVVYHSCRSTEMCFTHPLKMWRLLDHIAANSLLAFLILFVINYVNYSFNPFLYNVIKSSSEKEDVYKDIEDGIPIAKRKTRYYYENEDKMFSKYTGRMPIMAYDGWSITISYAYIFIVISSVLSYPFHIQSFIIVIAFGLVFIFFKFILIDETDIKYMRKRIHTSSLVFGIILSFTSILFFLGDSQGDKYFIFHSLWHAFTYTGPFFIIMGLTKDLDNWYSLKGMFRYIRNHTNLKYNPFRRI